MRDKKDQDIWGGFGTDIRHLNHSVVGRNVRSIPSGRAFLADGKPYVSNIYFERNAEHWMTHEKIQEHIAQAPAMHGRLYAGTAGEFNLSNIALSQAPAALLFDINPLQAIFWQDFFDVMAACPDREDFVDSMRFFAHSLSMKLCQMFDIDAIKADNPGFHMQSADPEDHRAVAERRRNMVDIDDILGGTLSGKDERKKHKTPQPVSLEALRRAVDNSVSPILNMCYRDMYPKFATPLGRDDAGYIMGGNKDLHWLANPDLYAHLHQMARRRAIGALTLDICDRESGKQLSEFLDGYGAKIGLLYLSNIAYYLDWDATEIVEQKNKGEMAKDFTGRVVEGNMWVHAIKNLKPLVYDDAFIMRFDNVSEGGLRPIFNPFFAVLHDRPVNIPRTGQPGGLSRLKPKL